MDVREQRGLEIAQTVKITRRKDGWSVPSQTGSGRYIVTLDNDAPACTCPDFEKRAQPCKHVYAVYWSLKAEVMTDGETTETTVTETKIVTDGETTVTETRQRKTYRQKWPSYNASQVNEKRDFQALLSNLCKGVEEPPQAMGRPRVPLADMAFSTAFKVYSTVSTRRFISDLTDAHAKGYISRLPHYNTVCKYLEQEDLTPVLRSLIEQSALPMKAIETYFAVDSTGFTTSRFKRWFDHRWGREISGHVWIKAHLMCGVQTNIVTACEITGADVHDSTQMAGLVDTTAENFKLGDVTADKAYSSRKNLDAVAAHGGTPYVPFKSFTTGKGDGNPLWQKMWGLYTYQREEFLSHYHRRSNMETTVSMIKGKFGDAIRSKTDTAMENELLCKVLCHNICVVAQSVYELGLRPTFGLDQAIS